MELVKRVSISAEIELNEYCELINNEVNQLANKEIIYAIDGNKDVQRLEWSLFYRYKEWGKKDIDTIKIRLIHGVVGLFIKSGTHAETFELCDIKNIVIEGLE